MFTTDNHSAPHSHARMNRYPRVYELSLKYGPPSIDLYQADVLDCYGDASFCRGPKVNHRTPCDVSREELNYYGTFSFSFMGFRDLLFYLHPVAFFSEIDPEGELANFYLMSLDSKYTQGVEKLREEDRSALRAGIEWMWFSGDERFGMWSFCSTLKKAIGIETFDYDL